MVTIHDVARKSGYSVSTVSRVLNQKNHVSKQAQQAIEQVIEELNFVPNKIARDLSRGKNGNIGVVLPHTKHPYFREIVNGIIDCAFSTKYRIVILPSEYDEEIEVEYLEQLRRKAVDALIFTSRGITLEKIAEYSQFGPIVCCEDPKRKDLFAVYSNRQPAYREAFYWLKEKGMKRIGILLSRDYHSSVTSQITLDTFREVFGYYPEKEDIILNSTTYEDGLRVGKELLNRKQPLDCLFVNVDDIAAGVREQFLTAGASVPLIVGQENQLSGKLLNFSTIDHHLREIGHQAFAMVIDPSKQKQVRLDSKFILRE
ncbi:LacI family DNA-binding transcriptional regulator [Enterococcus sp. LJL98]